jgi:thymidylate synthase ThyX
MISAKIVLDSVGTNASHRITTMELVMPRIVLAEFNTHRIFSRNSASSRAIPFEKMLKVVEDTPFIPIAWQKDHKGMQGTEYITDEQEVEYRKTLWLGARDNALYYAKKLNDSSTTKQLCNRLLEPFMYHRVLVTSTDFENFFKLRCPQYITPVMGEGFYARSWKDLIKNHSDPDNISKMENMSIVEKLQHNKGQAEIHIMALAEAMWDVMNESVPQRLKEGDWHIPYAYDDDSFATATALKISAARCARVSYTVVEGADRQHEVEADIKLANVLMTNGHASPMEHQAMYQPNLESRNFSHFLQYRQKLGL